MEIFFFFFLGQQSLSPPPTLSCCTKSGLCNQGDIECFNINNKNNRSSCRSFNSLSVSKASIICFLFSFFLCNPCVYSGLCSFVSSAEFRTLLFGEQVPKILSTLVL